MSGQLNEGQVLYLLALVRRDLRKHAKGIEDFERREGQSMDEAAGVLAHMESQQVFRRGVFDAVDRIRRAL